SENRDGADDVAIIRFGETDIRQTGHHKAIVLVIEDGDYLPEIVLDFQRAVRELETPVVAALAGNAKDSAWLVSQLCDACVYSRTRIYSAGNIGRGGTAVFALRFG